MSENKDLLIEELQNRVFQLETFIVDEGGTPPAPPDHPPGDDDDPPPGGKN